MICLPSLPPIPMLHTLYPTHLARSLTLLCPPLPQPPVFILPPLPLVFSLQSVPLPHPSLSPHPYLLPPLHGPLSSPLFTPSSGPTHLLYILMEHVTLMPLVTLILVLHSMTLLPKHPLLFTQMANLKPTRSPALSLQPYVLPSSIPWLSLPLPLPFSSLLTLLLLYTLSYDVYATLRPWGKASTIIC